MLWLRLISARFALVLLGVSIYTAGAVAHAVAQPPATTLSAEEQKEKQAADKFLELLIKKPAVGTALDRVFGYHVERGTIAGLVETLTQKAQQSQNEEEAGRYLLLVGLLQLQRGEDAQAVKALDRSQSLLKNNSSAAFHHGQALQLVGDNDGAARAFEAAIERKPSRNDYLSIARELGRLYQRLGRTQDALRIWSDLENAFPGDDSVRARIATTLVEEGDLNGALLRYEALAKTARSENDRIAFALDMARLRSQVGQKEQALKDFDELLSKLRPGSYLYEEARRRVESIFLSSGDYAGLTEYYQNWVESHPDDLNVILRLARTLSLQGRSLEAIEKFEQAVQRAPNDENAKLACIDAYIAANRFADAAALFGELIKANPKNPDYLVRYGKVLMSDTKQPEAARAQAAAVVWKRLSEANPKDAAVQSQVADLLRGARLTDEAIEHYRTAIALAPDEPQHKEYLGQYLHQLGRTDEALAVWQAIAEGDSRSLENLVRLAEVLYQFDKPAEALKVMADACELKPQVSHRLRYADWLTRAKEFDKADQQLTLAQSEAESEEEVERIFAAALKTYQAAGKLVERIEQAQAAADANSKSGELWRRLALLYEASENPVESLKAIQKAVSLEPNSIETLATAARMSAASGQTADAIDLRKRLVELDRRFRSGHLERLATLYAMTGQIDLAIATGKDLLASAGGAMDAFRFYANLCGQLGRNEERLDTLRRCLRLNPRSTEAVELLANQLADDFKTDQAIELVWKLLELSADIERRRAAVIKLTDLYLRSNRLDQLIQRLEFRGREANDRRTAMDLIATAYQQAGDFGLARDALESLLNENGRDTLLMERMVVLAQQAGEMDRAIELQRELIRLAPSKQAESRLAGLLITDGALDEAQALWLNSVDHRTDPIPLQRALDQLFTRGEYNAALTLCDKILQIHPSDWETLFRHMVFAKLTEQNEIAVKDAHVILAMNVTEDEESKLGKLNKSLPKPSSKSTSVVMSPNYPPQLRRMQTSTQVSRLIESINTPVRTLPSPDDFGAARLTARLILLMDADRKGEGDKLMDELKTQALSSTGTTRDVWDWYALGYCTVGTRPARFGHFRDPDAWIAPWRLLELDPNLALFILGMNFDSRRQYVLDESAQLKPLAEDRLAWLQEQSRKSKSDPKSNLQPSIDWQITYAVELIIAGKQQDAAEAIKDIQNRPGTSGIATSEVLRILSRQSSDDELWQAIEQAYTNGGASTGSASAGSARVSQVPGMLINHVGFFVDLERVKKKLSRGPEDPVYRARVMQLLDWLIAEQALQPTKANAMRLTNVGIARQTYQMVDNAYTLVQIGFPPSGIGPDNHHVQVLWSCREQLKNHVAVWVDRLTQSEEQMDHRVRVERLNSAAYLLFWSDKPNQAKELLEQSLKVAAAHVPAQEATIRLLLADLLLRQSLKQEALAMIDQLSVYDQSSMAVREFAAARLASVLGDKARAEQAARRLMSVRLDTDSQIELARLLRSLNMNALAADMVRRMRGRAGSSTAQLQALLNYFTSQDDKEAAAEVAMDLLQRTAPSTKPSSTRLTTEQMQRDQALQALARCGRLASYFESTKKRLERAPGSERIRAELADLYRFTGQVSELDQLLGKKVEQKGESIASLDASAGQLAGAGKWTEACDVYLKLIRRSPQSIRQKFYDLERAFMQAKRLAELADVIMEVGIEKFEIYRVTDVCERLNHSDQNYEKAQQLFVAMLSLPIGTTNVSQALNNLSNEYRYLIPSEDILLKVVDTIIQVSVYEMKGTTWSDAFSGHSTSSDGRKSNGLTALIRFVADKPAMAAALEKRLRDALVQHDKWLEGRVWLGLLKATTEKFIEAKSLLEPLLKERPDDTQDSLWVICSLMDSHRELDAITEPLYEDALKDYTNRNPNRRHDFRFTLPARVSQFMLDIGKRQRAKEIVLAEIEPFGTARQTPMYNDPSHEAYERVTQTTSLMTILAKVDAPVEALKLARKLDRHDFVKGAEYLGRDGAEARFDAQVKQIETELRQRGGLAILESTIVPETKSANAVDFGIVMDDHPFTGDGLKSLWLDMLAEIAAAPQSQDALIKLADRLKALRGSRPEDPSVRLGLALVNSYLGSRELLDDIVSTGLADGIAAGKNKADDKTANAAAEVADADNDLKSQWLMLAYLRWSQLEQARKSALDKSAIENWLMEHAQDWPVERTVTLLAELGKQYLIQPEPERAEQIWRMCLTWPGVTHEMLIDLALAAAQENLTALSLQSTTAFASAFEASQLKTSSKSTSSLGQLLNSIGQGNVVRSATYMDDDTQLPMANRLIQLDDVWSSQNVDPALVVPRLMDLVVADRDRLRPWPTKFDDSKNNASSQDWKLESVFDRLARRAHASGQTGELVSRLVGSDANGTSARLAASDIERAMLIALAWLRDDRGDKAVDYLKAVDKAQLNFVHRTLMLQTLLAALDDTACRRTAVELGIAWAAMNKPTQRYATAAPFDKLMLAIVRKAISSNLPKELRSSAVALYLELCGHENERFQGTSRFTRNISQLEEIAHLYLTQGNNVEALEIFSQRQSAYNQGGDIREDWLGNWLLANISTKSNRIEAYKLLADWTFQGEPGLNSIAVFARRAPLPTWIPASVGGNYPDLAPIVDQHVPLVSSFYTLALLSDEIKQSDQLIARYEAARDKKRPGATVGLAITLAALKRPVPDELLAELSARLESIRPEGKVSLPRTSAPLAELHLALIENINGQHPDWVRVTVAEVERHGAAIQREFLSPWLARYRYQQGWSDTKDWQPADALTHWTRNTIAGAKEFYEGKTAPLWLTDEQSQVAHLCGFGTDMFWLRYPLEGNFEFEFETQEGSGRRMDFYASGLHFTAASSYVYVASEQERDWIRVSSTVAKKDEWNKHTLILDDQALKYAVNGKVIYAEPRLPGPVWLALRSAGANQTVSRNIKLSGQPRVARSVAALPVDHLRGWSGAYYDQALPTSKLELPAVTDDRSQSLRNGYSPSDKTNLGWTVDNGELQSGVGYTGGPGNQSLIQYLRPLLPGETIDYEFYYQPGKFEVHPSLGRTAFLIRPAGLERHWLTEPHTSWKTPADNHFAVDGAGPLKLLSGQWNTARLEAGSDRLIISINGQVAAELPWRYDVSHNTFGLFHVKGQTQVRVRNVVISGPWPETLSTGLFSRP